MSDHHHGHCDGHDHHDNTNQGLFYSLYQQIDKDNLDCLNEKVFGSSKSIFKPWEERLNFDTVVESDCDPELLFNIPFISNVKLKGIIIIGGYGESRPTKMRLYKNRPNMSFDDVGIPADEEFELTADQDGSVEYPVTIVKFSSISNLTIHIPTCAGGEATKIFYIGLRGEYSAAHRHGVTICSYEALPGASEHFHHKFKAHSDFTGLC